MADTTMWPQYLPPNIHVRRTEFDGVDERLRMWATANGTVKSWTSRRKLDAKARRIEFRQEVSAAPVESMCGTWVVEPLGPDDCRLTLLHDFTVVDDAPEHVAWVEKATDRNSGRELGNLKSLAEKHSELGELMFSFADEVRVDGSADAAYEFLDRAERWPDRLPHVARLDLVEDEPGVQLMSMDTRTADGSTHTTESVRICFPAERRIVYKQTRTPALMDVHTGEWTVRPVDGGAVIRSQHTVILRDAEHRDFVREALSRNSIATMNLAESYA
ncbi:aromatase/cyclase [Kutzneria kofuensis]|uniref:aromatase/cyclase n=1 Tax=Kutzneria kofuensis TaxID=103725 RepID=UPI0035EEC07B